MIRAEIRAVLDRVRTWPEDRQAELARIALHIEAQDAEVAPEDASTRAAAIAEGRAQARRRKFASDERVSAVWKKFGL
jgi:hypothetical protein